MTAGGSAKKVWYLRRLDLFTELSAADIERLAALLNDRFLPAGVELLGRREREQVFLVKTGAVRVDIGHQPRQATVALLGPGRMFGLSSALGETAPVVTARTVVPSYVCITTWATLFEVLADHPRVLLRMIGSLAEYVFRIETWRVWLGGAAPAARLARLVLELADEFGEPVANGQMIPIPLGRADLARMVGSSRETASRVMAGFERSGWVGQEGGRLIVRNRPALAAAMRGKRGRFGMVGAEEETNDPGALP